MGTPSVLWHSFIPYPSRVPARTGNWEEEGSLPPYRTCPTFCVAGLPFLPVTFTRGTSECRGRVGGGPEERLAFLVLPSPVHCPPPPRQGDPFSSLLRISSIFAPAPHLNLALTPEPQERSQGVQGDQADQPQDWEQPPGSHSSAPFSQVLQRTEGAEDPSAPAGSGQYPPSTRCRPSSSRPSCDPAPSLTPVLAPDLAPPLGPACSPLAAVVQQEGQPGLSQVLARQAGAFREGQAVRVLEEKPRRAAASCVRGEEVT